VPVVDVVVANNRLDTINSYPLMNNAKIAPFIDSLKGVLYWCALFLTHSFWQPCHPFMISDFAYPCHHGFALLGEVRAGKFIAELQAL
jgi:hypothetical protein